MKNIFDFKPPKPKREKVVPKFEGDDTDPYMMKWDLTAIDE